MLVLIISNANSGVNRRTKDKIISLSLLSVVLFLSRFFFCVLSERGANAFVMVRYILLHSSNKEF